MFDTKTLNAFGTRSYPDQTIFADFSRKIGIFRQKPVARDNGVYVVVFGDLDNGITVIEISEQDIRRARRSHASYMDSLWTKIKRLMTGKRTLQRHYRAIIGSRGPI